MALNYERIGWENAPSTNTPIDAGSLNHMDNGILAVSNQYDVDVPYLQQQVAGIPAMLDSYLAEEIGTDVTAWLNAHVTPGGSTIVVDDTLSISGAAADSAKCGELKNALTTKAEQDGAYPDLTAGQLLSKNESSDSVPYNFRAVGQDATLEYTDAIVGGSVVWNQLYKATARTHGSGVVITVGEYGEAILNGTASSTDLGATIAFGINVLQYHKYILLGGTSDNPIRDSFSQINAPTVVTFSTSTAINIQTTIVSGTTYTNAHIYGIFTDLTVMLGTTLADYIYSLEQANAGAGVAWLQKHFPKLFTYQSYNAGEIVSVQGLSQHVTLDADNNIIGTYPLDSTKTFRGIFKLDSSNNLYADGDRYLPDGTVQRRYGVRAYQSGDVTDGSTMITDGTNTVYKLTTTTTEEADPYTVPQIVDPDGTEEYVSTSIVPVGHESRYPLDIAGTLDKILTMPTANGTYTLRATVNNGAVTYAWVST